MSTARNGDAIVAETFLEVRAKLLEVAATLDRIDRSSRDEPLDSPAKQKRELLGQAIAIVASADPNRAEQLQQLFSRPYEEDWRKTMGVSSP